MSDAAPEKMRIDRLLVCLRFARTRTAARAMIEGRALRLNRKHVRRVSETVAIGDVLTLMIGNEVRVIKLVSLPSRRGPPALAQSHYSELDPYG